jgi:nucleotide-binding universal stress UspA family protein
MAPLNPRILVAFDDSAAARKALSWAADLQNLLGGPPMHAIQISNPNPPINAVEVSVILPLTETSLEGMRKALADSVAKSGAQATTEVILASAIGPAIVEAGLGWRADMIVMGTHGRGGIARLLIGSVAEYVLRHAACPVLTLRDGPVVRPAANKSVQPVVD